MSLASPECDVSTSSNYLDVRVTHFHLDLHVDFERRVLSGTATVKFKTLIDTSDKDQVAFKAN